MLRSELASAVLLVQLGWIVDACVGSTHTISVPSRSLRSSARPPATRYGYGSGFCCSPPTLAACRASGTDRRTAMLGSSSHPQRIAPDIRSGHQAASCRSSSALPDVNLRPSITTVRLAGATDRATHRRRDPAHKVALVLRVGNKFRAYLSLTGFLPHQDRRIIDG